MASQPRIFISCARGDGKAFAVDLRRRLEKHGMPLWHDLADMEGGRDWLRQITEAIDACEYLVLVLTPRAVASKVVRDEWRYARQQGTAVVPVFGAWDVDLDPLPGWMRRAHVYDLDEPDQWRHFVHQLEGPADVPRVPMMAAELEADFVQRPAELEGLVAALLDEAREEPVAITAALKGAGGYGKTTLARALCHDERVLDAFHDGILWVTLGERPGDPMGRVQDLIEVLSGARGGFQTLEAATTRLAELLADRRALLVIDDVWQAGHLRPFLRGGPHCARVVTTRNRDTLPAGAARIDVDAMAESEAVRVLRFGLPDGEAEAFERLAAHLGEWPLLLKLVNGALRRRVDEAHQPLADAVAYVDKALDRRGLTAFDARDSDARSDAVARTLGVSLELLGADERARFEALAVFPEDEEVPLAVVETLWDLDDFDTEELCQRLFHLSLLLSLDLATRRLRLHDVVRHYLCDQQKDHLPDLHASLIEAYRQKCPDGWPAGPDDGHFFQWLPWHLAEAGRRGDCRALAFDYPWLRRKLEVAGVDALVGDLFRLGDDHEARRLAGALCLSARVVVDDPRQLAGQLLGRLHEGDGAAIAELLGAARVLVDRPALLPRRRSLTPPDGTLLVTLAGHGAGVMAVALTPDGRRAVSGSRDGTLKIWDLEAGALLSTLAGHGDWVLAVAVTPDGRRAISGSYDRTLKVWDLEAGALLVTLEGHGAGVRAVSVTPDGRRAVSGSSDRTLKVWDLDTSTLASTLEGHGNLVLAVSVTPDGRRVVSGSYDRTLKIWDLEAGALLSTLGGHEDWLWAVSVTPDGRRVVSGSRDGTLKIWDLEAGALLSTLEGHDNWVMAVAVTPDGRRAVSGSWDRTLRLRDLETGRQLAVFSADSEIAGLAVTPDGRLVIAGDGIGRIHTLEILA